MKKLLVALFVCAAWRAAAECPLDRPELASPERGARFAEGETIEFSWEGIPRATGYDLLITPDFGRTWETLASTGSTSHADKLPKGDWGWYVKAHRGDACPPTTSEPSHFSVGPLCENTAPVPVSPADGATVSLPVTFEWEAAKGATSYEVHALIGRELELLGETDGTSLDVTEGLEGTIVWAVKASFPDCPAITSEKSTVTIKPANTCATGEAALVSPPDGATNLSSPVTFDWEAVPGATGYRVLAAIGSSELVTLDFTTETSLTTDVPEGSGYWLVQTFFGENCPSTLSERSSLTVTKGVGCENSGPDLVSPEDGATGVESPVTFDWNSQRLATKYALFVSSDGGEFDLYGVTEETELSGFVPDGLIRWFVIAFFAGCPEERSGISSFTVGTKDDCPEGEIALNSPAEGATVGSPVTLSWSGISGVQAYRVTITDGDASITERTALPELSIELPAGPMTWYVEGLREGCEPIVSGEGHFTVQRAANCDANVAPALVSPVGTEENPAAATSPVTFSWNSTPNALGYRLWISRGGNAYEDARLTDETSATLVLPGGRYGWFIEAIFRGCDPLASGEAFFTVVETEARCSDEAPDAVSPGQGSTVAAPVTFVWNPVEKAGAYRVFVSIDGSEERLIGATEETSLTRVLPPGAASWRVEAVFKECRATSSPSVEFTIPEAANCSDDKPELSSPADGSTVSDPQVEFAWTPVSGAVRYVIVARTEDGSAVPIGETEDTSFSRRMPFGEIEWSVVAFFAGCEPAHSESSKFTLAADVQCTNRSPVLLLPGGNEREIHSPVTFAWTKVPGATSYQIWVAQGSPAGVAASTTDNTAEVELPEGTYEWFVEADFPNCPSTQSASAEFTVGPPIACGTPEQTSGHVVGQALSGTPYVLRWSPLPNVSVYEVQESTSPDFENAETIVTTRPAVRFVHENSGGPVQYLYRIRGVSSCDDSRGAFSDPVGVFVVAKRTNMASAEFGLEDAIVQTIVLPGSSTPLKFTATVDKPWLTVTPSTGTLGADPVTLTVTADPKVLYLGTNTGTVKVAYTAATAGKVTTHNTTTSVVPISVSLVTPVTPTGKGTPPPDALIFPIVGHAAGANDSLFESDIRIANLTPQTMKYEVNFTPSNTDGTQKGSSTTIEVAPNTTTALDDIVSSVFGTGTTSSALGMLEVRPLTTTSTSSSLFSSVSATFPSLSTAASSRTYNFTPNGTFGQFIPAVRFADFAGKGTVLSLLQVEHSENYRANFGFAEASGSPVDLMVRVYDTRSSLLATIPVSLGASQHTQINGMLAANGINDLADGRVEVEVVNGSGKVTAYVSEIDNKTNDPLLVDAEVKGSTSANRYVVPGMAYINTGAAFWVSDLRVFNAGTTSTPATLTFYPQSGASPVSKDVTIDGGEIEVLDNVVGDFFGQATGAGGAVAITTPGNTKLSATARTYNQTANGTYGQFIPGVTAAQSIGNGDRALQILQLETSSRFRTNVGVTETTGNPVTVEIAAIQPDSIVTPVITLDLAPNQFYQFPLASFFDDGAAVYNARVTVKVIGGTGRVTAYGSAIDLITQDPTYVPAQ